MFCPVCCTVRLLSWCCATSPCAQSCFEEAGRLLLLRPRQQAISSDQQAAMGALCGRRYTEIWAPAMLARIHPVQLGWLTSQIYLWFTVVVYVYASYDDHISDRRKTRCVFVMKLHLLMVHVEICKKMVLGWYFCMSCSRQSANLDKMDRNSLYENTRVSNLPRVDGVQNSPNNFDLNPVTLTYDILPWPLTLVILTLVTLTLDHLFWN